MSSNRLFTHLQLGNIQLSHRIVMAPLTRFRADDAHNPSKYAREYYEQRASVPGTFLVTEATFISPRAAGYKYAPGIWSPEQVEAWKEITGAVHAKGSFIYLQLWALGRVANPEVLKEEGGYRLLSSSPSALNAESAVPEAMTREEIDGFIQDYASAARNAMKAGFDGVEIHGANGYLIDQFSQDVVNHRTDSYGGSISNRARFGLEVTRAVIDAVGDSRKVGVRMSPFSTFQGMCMADPIPQFLYLTQELRKLDLAYLHLIESRISGSSADGVYKDINHENDLLIEAWGADPILLAGGFTPEKSDRVVNEIHPSKNVCVVFGRYFISNPDLPFRLQNGIGLNKWDRPSFYLPGTAEGYTDYAFSGEWLERQSSARLAGATRA